MENTKVIMKKKKHIHKITSKKESIRLIIPGVMMIIIHS